MAFRIREITVHLMGGGMGPCHPASPDTATQRPGDCKPRTNRGNPKPEEGEKKRSLDLLQAQLRRTLAVPR
jgi:hypothetical protein